MTARSSPNREAVRQNYRIPVLQVQNWRANPALDIQEALKILRFRFRRNVVFRPALQRAGVAYYLVDGKLRAESEIVRWAERGRMPATQTEAAS